MDHRKVDLNKVKNIHLMGVGGAGMSGLALLFHELGYHVTGCDMGRSSYIEKLEKAGLHVFTIEQLQKRAEKLVGVPDPIRYKDRIVGVVMYRDNTIIDVIRQIDEDA